MKEIFKLKQLKQLVKSKGAIDITYGDNDTRKEIEEKENGYEVIGYSMGLYGCNGKLLKGNKTNTLYAITKRTGAIFIF